ncbi:MAG: transglycosylase domain-containing protein [Prolixibacteraceae bacterium]|jgi:penicillin-binding protein 1A|nr:transglycosylase domain-containing protein [Prolixibacteraceae bacterium]
METEKTNFKIYLKIFWGTIVATIIFTIVFFWLIAYGKIGLMPTFEELENPKNLIASEIITSDNQLLGKYYKSENRTLVEFESLNKHLVNALIATEDERYYSHSGIDLRGLFRVVKGVVTNNTNQGGGSTISQQLAKLLFPRESNSGIKLVVRKFREWIIAVKLERSYTKEEIIAMYLNKFEFINNAFGIEVASQTYFNVPQDSLKMHQAAMLIGMLKNPGLYNPVRFKDRSLTRRNVVLSQMKKNYYINREEYDSTTTKPLEVNFNRSALKKGIAPYFRKYLERTIISSKPDRTKYGNSDRSKQKFLEDSVAWHTDPLYGWCNKNLKPDGEPFDLYKDGLKIYTTLNYSMQEYAENAVEFNLKRIQPSFTREVDAKKNPPFSNDISDEDAKRLLRNEVFKSHRYKQLKKKGLSQERIMKVFETPDTILIYTWDGYKDTLMAPIDSIRYYLKNLSSSFMAMDPNTGAVKAWVGGASYGFTEIDMVRSSTYKRQVGSTCKPFLYTLAMQNGMSPCKMVPNVEHTLINPDGTPYTAKNSNPSEYDGQMVTLKWGLAHSVNQISAWVMKQHSPALMKDLMQKLGIYSEIPEVNSLFLGPAEITLYEMIAAYAVYANKGVYTTPIIVSRIEDKNGNVLARFTPRRHDAIDEKTAYLMTYLLQNVVKTGSGRRLTYNFEPFTEYAGFEGSFAGKTGTTQNQSDGWFVGYSPELVAGVWTGANLRSIHFEDLGRGSGSNMALPVFGRFFKQVFADSTLNYTQDFEFEKPENFNIDLNCNDHPSETEENIPVFDDIW